MRTSEMRNNDLNAKEDQQTSENDDSRRNIANERNAQQRSSEREAMKKIVERSRTIRRTKRTKSECAQHNDTTIGTRMKIDRRATENNSRNIANDE